MGRFDCIYIVFYDLIFLQSLILLLHASDVIVLHCSLHALIGLVQRYDIINTFL